MGDGDIAGAANFQPALGGLGHAHDVRTDRIPQLGFFDQDLDLQLVGVLVLISAHVDGTVEVVQAPGVILVVLEMLPVGERIGGLGGLAAGEAEDAKGEGQHGQCDVAVHVFLRWCCFLRSCSPDLGRLITLVYYTNFVNLSSTSR